MKKTNKPFWSRLLQTYVKYGATGELIKRSINSSMIWLPMTEEEKRQALRPYLYPFKNL